MLQGRDLSRKVLGFPNATETGPQSLSTRGRGHTFRSQGHRARVRLGLRGHNASSTLIWIEGSPLTVQPVSERLEEEEECRDRQSSMEGRGVGQGLLRGVGYVSALSQSASSSIWEGRQPQRTRQASERADGCACVTLLIVNALCMIIAVTIQRLKTSLSSYSEDFSLGSNSAKQTTSYHV